MNRTVYLDHNSTTPLDPEVLEAMLPFLRDEFGNAASTHQLGRRAREAVEKSREQVEESIGCQSGRIVFTSSATEANNLFFKGIASGEHRRSFVVAKTEHKSVVEPLRSLRQEGRADVSWILPDGSGRITPEAVLDAIRCEGSVVSVMAANNVVHTINPLAEISLALAETGLLLHSDITQAIGRIPLNVEETGIDAASLSGHKIYGPKGVGALYLSQLALRSGLKPLIEGGGHEFGLRSGTINVPAVVGFGVACSLAAERLPDDAQHAASLAKVLRAELRSRIPDAVFNGHPVQRLPGGVHLTIPGIDSRGLIAAIPDLAFSDGSACESGGEADHVITELVGVDAAHSSIRLQVGRSNTRDDVVCAAERIANAAKELRNLASYLR